VLDMPERYDLYVTSGVRGGAQTVGSGKPMIVVDSALLQLLGTGDKRVVVAHELGHILSDHVLYMTALNILLSAAGGGVPFPFGLPIRAVQAVLLEWYRAAELSCDRAATLAVRDPRIVCRTLMVTAGMLPADQLNLDAFMNQAMEYENWDDPSDRVRRFFSEIGQSHTYAVRRVSEVMKWVQSGDYDRIVRGEYRTRHQHSDVREEASEAMDFYAERFRAIFREMGENLNSLGSQMGGMAEQVADWVRSRGGGGGGGGSGSGGGSRGSGGSGGGSRGSGGSGGGSRGSGGSGGGSRGSGGSGGSDGPGDPDGPSGG
jgi:hypothetical protein